MQNSTLRIVKDPVVLKKEERQDIFVTSECVGRNSWYFLLFLRKNEIPKEDYLYAIA